MNQRVQFNLNNGEVIKGCIAIVDNGIFEDPYNIYYDILGDDDILYKHVPKKITQLI